MNKEQLKKDKYVIKLMEMSKEIGKAEELKRELEFLTELDNCSGILSGPLGMIRGRIRRLKEQTQEVKKK